MEELKNSESWAALSDEDKKSVGVFIFFYEVCEVNLITLPKENHTFKFCSFTVL